MDALTLFGVVSVAAMLVFYALEERRGKPVERRRRARRGER
jgi:hypothetical protein